MTYQVRNFDHLQLSEFDYTSCQVFLYDWVWPNIFQLCEHIKGTSLVQLSIQL